MLKVNRLKIVKDCHKTIYVCKYILVYFNPAPPSSCVQSHAAIILRAIPRCHHPAGSPAPPSSCMQSHAPIILRTAPRHHHPACSSTPPSSCVQSHATMHPACCWRGKATRGGDVSCCHAVFPPRIKIPLGGNQADRSRILSPSSNHRRNQGLLFNQQVSAMVTAFRK